MPKIHDQATKARALGKSLTHHQFGSELSKELIRHADMMDVIYGKAAKNVKDNILQSASRLHLGHRLRSHIFAVAES
eukprot:7954694-Pyramimonas_sp.AAC.1